MVILLAAMLALPGKPGHALLELEKDVDRAEAILRGVDMLAPGDALLVCGKGHETGQVVGQDILPFDDAEQASLAVSALDGGVG